MRGYLYLVARLCSGTSLPLPRTFKAKKEAARLLSGVRNNCRWAKATYIVDICRLNAWKGTSWSVSCCELPLTSTDLDSVGLLEPRGVIPVCIPCCCPLPASKRCRRCWGEPGAAASDCRKRTSRPWFGRRWSSPTPCPAPCCSEMLTGEEGATSAMFALNITEYNGLADMKEKAWGAQSSKKQEAWS